MFDSILRFCSSKRNISPHNSVLNPCLVFFFFFPLLIKKGILKRFEILTLTFFCGVLGVTKIKIIYWWWPVRMKSHDIFLVLKWSHLYQMGWGQNLYLCIEKYDWKSFKTTVNKSIWPNLKDIGSSPCFEPTRWCPMAKTQQSKSIITDQLRSKQKDFGSSQCLDDPLHQSPKAKDPTIQIYYHGPI